MREKFRELLLRHLPFIYPNSKIFHFIVDGLKSKNVRTRIECVEMFEAMIERLGIEVRNVSAQRARGSQCL